jgi:hypothetical protein
MNIVPLCGQILGGRSYIVLSIFSSNGRLNKSRLAYLRLLEEMKASQASFAQKLYVPANSAVAVSQLRGGVQIYEYKGKPPEKL